MFVFPNTKSFSSGNNQDRSHLVFSNHFCNFQIVEAFHVIDKGCPITMKQSIYLNHTYYFPQLYMSLI